MSALRPGCSRARTGSDTPMQPERPGETAVTPPDADFVVAWRRSGGLILLLEWVGEQAARSQARTVAGLCASRLQPAVSPLPGRGNFSLRKKPTRVCCAVPAAFPLWALGVLAGGQKENSGGFALRGQQVFNDAQNVLLLAAREVTAGVSPQY